MPKPKARKKNVKTPFGILDRKVLEDLRGNYDTWALLAAIDAVDQVRYRDDEVCEGIQTLHGMAMYLINDNYSAGTPGETTIDELADWLTGELQQGILAPDARRAMIRITRTSQQLNSEKVLYNKKSLLLFCFLTQSCL